MENDIRQMNTITKIISDTFKSIGKNIPILIVLILGNVGYGFLYNLLYNTNVYRNSPIAVVDMSQSDISRRFTNYIDATQQVDVVLKTQNYYEAKQKLIENEIIGFVYIPSELKENIMKGKKTECIIYGSTLSFLNYLNISESVNFSSLEINSELLPEMLKSLNMIDLLFLANDKAISIISEPLYNESEGYGTYLIPPVMVIIIFQTMMIVVCMNEINLRKSRLRTKAYKIIFGRALAYVLIYTVFSVFFLGLLPLIFHLPHLGDFINIAVLMIPYLFASTFFAMILSSFFTDAEMPLFFIVVMSVPLVFLTGISYPLELMPWHWKIFHYIIPVAPATMAFVKLDCMGAELIHTRPEMINLWSQCVVYFIIAVIMRKRYSNNYALWGHL